MWVVQIITMHLSRPENNFECRCWFCHSVSLPCRPCPPIHITVRTSASLKRGSLYANWRLFVTHSLQTRTTRRTRVAQAVPACFCRQIPPGYYAMQLLMELVQWFLIDHVRIQWAELKFIAVNNWFNFKITKLGSLGHLNWLHFFTNQLRQVFKWIFI